MRHSPTKSRRAVGNGTMSIFNSYISGARERRFCFLQVIELEQICLTAIFAAVVAEEI